MKFFNTTALTVLFFAFTTIACTNQEVVEDTNYKLKDIQEVEITHIVDEQDDSDDNYIDLPTAKRDPIIKIKRDRD